MSSNSDPHASEKDTPKESSAEVSPSQNAQAIQHDEMPPLAEQKIDRKIAIALGSGSARGWAHIGVLKALKKEGIEADIVCGASIGAIVGAAYAHDRLDDLEQWATSLTRWKLLRFIDVTLSSGSIVKAKKIRDELSEVIGDHNINIEDLQKPFAAVATDMLNGHEIRFLHGSLNQAVLASTSIPGFMPPVFYKQRWIIDGGVVNPVPVSVCRIFEPEHVLAVNLNGNIIKGKVNDPNREKMDKDIRSISPGMFDSFANAINIMQDRITRSRMVGDPPDFLITPRVAHIGMMDFDKAEEIIEEGYQAVERQLSEIKHILEPDAD